MNDGYQTETLTYAELIERSNEIIERLRKKGTLKLTLNMDAPPDAYKDVAITMRIDPHERQMIALQNVVELPVSQFLGLRVLSGDRQGSLVFASFYDTLAKCVQIEGVATRAEWRDLLESDTPEGDAMQDMIAVITISYQWHIIDAEGK